MIEKLKNDKHGAENVDVRFVCVEHGWKEVERSQKLSEFNGWQ